ncbi:MAG: MFS transporter [Clostridium septicum]|uniref:MFS transporter n=1 Tax=uncultured Clostridium sp. TaxID=59620 RepID=UPI002902083D|nr:MFS transporter [Clostridium septicum]MDU1313152.1 MFS transporter [Clostridium septicum]
MSKLSKEEKSWILYDWANSAYSMTITATILPIYFKMVAENGGMSSSTSTAFWEYSISISTFLVVMLAPILGNIADYKGNKKKFFNIFFILGVISTIFLAFIPTNTPVLLLFAYVITVLGFSGANIFYDSFLVDVTTEDRMDYVSSMGYGMGYIFF